MITNLNIKGFKSFRDFAIQPGHMNLVIGANGTGKSNLADLIRFIARISKEGLKTTINNMGGENSIRTRTTRAPRTFHIEFELDQDMPRGIEFVKYGFELSQSKGDIRVSSEWLTAKVYKRTAGKPKKQGFPLFDLKSPPLELNFMRNSTQINQLSNALTRLESDFASIESDSLILSAFNQVGEIRTITDYISSWRAYNIDAALSKQAMGKGDIELSPNGDNLVPFLIRILGDDSLRDALLSQIKEPVPYIKDIQPEFSPFHTLRFSETDSGNEFQLPDMSDGTIRLLGLFAIFLQKIPPAVILLEEPENALHRYAINRVLNLAYQVATRNEFSSQVFLTSHSPIVADEILSTEKLLDKEHKTRCFVSQREKISIVPAPAKTMESIANNLGRPSEYIIDGAMGDKPIRPRKPIIEENGE